MSVLCPLLWNHSYVSSTSNVRPCCMSRPQDLDDWKQSKLSQGINSPAHIKARDQMRNGIWPKACTICKKEEQQYNHSARIVALKQQDKVNYTKEPTIENITTMDIKFNNTCNLSCVMCNTGSSSKINEFVKQHKRNAPESMGSVIRDDIWQEDEKLEWCKKVIALGNLKEFKTTGGEPFAQKHFWRLIDWCIENDYTYFDISITTNGTKFNSLYLDKLIKFKKIRLVISCDGTQGVYEYIRHGATWQKFVDNINRLTTYISKHPDKFTKPDLHCVLQVYNCDNISSLKEFADQNNLTLTIDPFIHPKDTLFTIAVLPDKLRAKILKYSKVRDTSMAMSRYITAMSSIKHNPWIVRKFADQTQKLDKTRNTSYKTLGNLVSDYIFTKIG